MKNSAVLNLLFLFSGGWGKRATRCFKGPFCFFPLFQTTRSSQGHSALPLICYDSPLRTIHHPFSSFAIFTPSHDLFTSSPQFILRSARCCLNPVQHSALRHWQVQTMPLRKTPTYKRDICDSGKKSMEDDLENLPLGWWHLCCLRCSVNKCKRNICIDNSKIVTVAKCFYI